MILKMKYTLRRLLLSLCAPAIFALAGASPAQALQLDLSSQFWSYVHGLNNTQLNRSRPGYDNDERIYNAGGTYVPGNGEKNNVWYAAFMRLKPKVVVNDSIQIKSEWHLGSPIYGFMGRDFPASGGEQYNLTGSNRGGATISAQRFWANLTTDYGTIEIGRMPIHWGLGAMWHSGDNLWDRYQSTGDMVRLTTKFGNLSISPAVSKMAVGNSVAGALDNASSTGSNPNWVNPRAGNDDVTDYHVAVKYDNTEEDFDFGLMWTRRTGNAAQSALLASPASTGSRKLNFNILDFYARKKMGRFTLGLEVPLFTGSVGGIDGSANDFEYQTVAAIAEAGYSSEQWDISFKGGHVPGQPDVAPGNAANPTAAFIESGAKYRPVYLHKNYGLGLIMFKYNLYGLSANNPDTMTSAQLRSPYDNPIVNANYASLSPTFKLDKWSFFTTFVAAWASRTAPANSGGNFRKFYNHQRRQFFTTASGAGEQRSFMGWEADLGVSFRWDDNFVMDWTNGIYFPGPYFEHTNLPAPDASVKASDFLFASQLRAGITF